MLLTISTRTKPTSNLGFLLHKHPGKFQSVNLSIGKAHLFYPENTEDISTIAVVLDIDPIDMVRGVRNMAGKGFSLGQYVNDRPYVSSSFMSVALSKAFSTAMNGKCSDKPELVEEKLEMEVFISSLPAPRGGELLIRKFFEPLGYEVEVERLVLDEQFADWGDSKYYSLKLKGRFRIQDLLSHLYVLIPSLDNDQHYFVSQNEIDKLLEKGKNWLSEHPEKEQITRRYLINLHSLTRQALERLSERDDEKEDEETELSEEEKVKKESLHQRRLTQVKEELLKTGAESVLDLGCGEGKLIKLLLKERQFRKIAGMDLSYSELLKCKERLHFDELAPKQKERIDLFQGALTYRDERLSGYDAAAVVEVIEHLDENRLVAFERVLFECAKPQSVVLTTPNGEYNVKFETMEAGSMRHTDHRFEWTRTEFEEWANGVAERNGYSVKYLPVGDVDEKVGAPSQMAIFSYGD